MLNLIFGKKAVTWFRERCPANTLKNDLRYAPVVELRTFGRATFKPSRARRRPPRGHDRTRARHAPHGPHPTTC